MRSSEATIGQPHAAGIIWRAKMVIFVFPSSYHFPTLLVARFFFVQGYRINHSESIIISVGLRAVWLSSYFLSVTGKNGRKTVEN